MDQNKQQLPNATGALVLGILSIVFCWAWGIIGLILSIITLVISKKPMAMLKENPDAYSNGGNLKAGRIMGIIGLVLSGLFLLYIIVVVAIIGGTALSLGSVFSGM